MPEKLPVPSLESIQLLTQDVGSVFQGKMNSVVVALRNALIAFNAQIDAAETASQQVEPAPEAIALEGANNTYKMTPLRSAQLIEKLLTDATADEAEALTGTSDKLITALLLDLVLEWRLGTTGNLGTAAQRNVMASPTDATTPDALMPRGAFGFGSTYQGGVDTPVVPNSNLDGIDPMGHYRYTEDMVGKPNFGSGYGTVFNLPAVNAGGLNYGSQVAVDYSSNEMGFRQLTGNVWSGWCRNYHNRNVVGAVAQSGGVPTGAIIERGDNVIGHYTKYADGTLDCWLTLTIPAHGLNQDAIVSATWPHQFVGGQRIIWSVAKQLGSGSAEVVGLLQQNGIYTMSDLTTCTMASYSYRHAITAPVEIHILGKGRWN